MFNLCTPAGARTLDTLIKSQVLYQLSYGCIALFCDLRVQRYTYFLKYPNFSAIFFNYLPFFVDFLFFFVSLQS